MKEQQRRDRFIPFRKTDLVEMCIADKLFPDSQRNSFQELCRILESIIHFEFHRLLETLKDCYAPFNPDTDIRSIRSYSEEERQRLQKELVESMIALLEAANFQKITKADLEEALGEESLFQIRLEVDFEDFEDVIFYRRGESRRKETLVKFFGLIKEPFEFTNYDRVVVYMKFKEAQYFQERKQKSVYFTPGSTVVKLFQNVPKADLEMLFPNSEVRMKTIDKLIIGVPAAVSGLVVIATKLGASILLIASIVAFWLGFTDKEARIEQTHLVALALGLATLGGFIFKQINKFKNRKIRFMKALADSLYFKNLDNNAGVFHHLIDAAEEEEFKEAVLAYYFLLREEQSLTISQLDTVVERWFETNYGCKIDFEIEDALRKLERLRLVNKDGDGVRCKNLEDAKRQLDTMWDDYFRYCQADETLKT